MSDSCLICNQCDEEVKDMYELYLHKKEGCQSARYCSSCGINPYLHKLMVHIFEELINKENIYSESSDDEEEQKEEEQKEEEKEEEPSRGGMEEKKEKKDDEEELHPLTKFMMEKVEQTEDPDNEGLTLGLIWNLLKKELPYTRMKILKKHVMKYLEDHNIPRIDERRLAGKHQRSVYPTLKFKS